MCESLDIARSTYYYESKSSPSDDESLTEEIQEIFRANRRTYGTRRIKKELSKKGKVVSRRKISRIMKKLGLQSCYTVAHYRVHQPKSNESVQRIPQIRFIALRLMDPIVGYRVTGL